MYGIAQSKCYQEICIKNARRAATSVASSLSVYSSFRIGNILFRMSVSRGVNSRSGGEADRNECNMLARSEAY